MDGRIPADSVHQPRSFPATTTDEDGDLIVFGRCAMPIHNWTRLELGDFHHFHQAWITYLGDTLNGGGLPPGFMALSERVTDESPSSRPAQVYAKRKDRVIIRHGRGRVVAIIELVSLGNKNSRHAIRLCKNSLVF